MLATKPARSLCHHREVSTQRETGCVIRSCFELEALLLFDVVDGSDELTHAIADGLSDSYLVRFAPMSDTAQLASSTFTLLVVGTSAHPLRMRPPLGGLAAQLPRAALHGIQAAAFDMRYRLARFAGGAAASESAATLTEAGCRLLMKPESFFIRPNYFLERLSPAQASLEVGELDRAREWARALGIRSRLI
jgi:hypothetical protein